MDIPDQMLSTFIGAAHKGDLDQLRHALDDGVDVNQCLNQAERDSIQDLEDDASFYSALTAAVRYSQLKAARLLLEHGADVHLRPKDPVEGKPPSAIEMATDIADMNMLALLMEHDELAPWPPFGEESLLARIANLPAHECDDEHREAAQWLIDHGYTVTTRSYEVKKGSMIEAARLTRNLDPLDIFLAKGPNHKPSEFMPDAASARLIAFFKAAIIGDLDTLQAIIDQGIDVNVLPSTQEEEVFCRSDQRSSALVHAARHGHITCVKLLLEHGADVHLKRGEYSPTALQEAADCGQLEILQMLIDYDPVPGHTMAGENTCSPEVSPLITLARLSEGELYPSNVAAFRMLLSSGFSPDVFCENKMSVMQYASQSHNRIILEILVEEFGANVDFCDDDDGMTPLLALCRDTLPYSLERVEYLLAHGADLFKLDHQGRSALHLVARWGSPTMFEALMDKGAWEPNHCSLHFPPSTILHEAALGLNIVMLEHLLSHAFDINAIDPKSGETPLQAIISTHGRRFARSYKNRALQDKVVEYDATVALLKKHGARDHVHHIDPRL